MMCAVAIQHKTRGLAAASICLVSGYTRENMWDGEKWYFQYIVWPCVVICVEDMLSIFRCHRTCIPLEMLSPEQLFFDFLKEENLKENITSVVSALKDDELSKYCWTRMNDFCFCWCELSAPSCRPLMQHSIVLRSCRKLKEKIRGVLVKGRGGEGQKWRAARKGFLGHGARKWTSLAWPAGARSQSVGIHTWQRSKSICFRKHKDQIILF